MRTLVAFGIGKGTYPWIERLDKVCRIDLFCDNNARLWGQYIMGDERACIPPQSLCALEDPLVIIMCEKESSIHAVEEQCAGYGVECRRISEFIKETAFEPAECKWPQTIQKKRIHKFIELLVHGTTECNFHCEYCYVWNTQEFTHRTETSQYTPEEIRKALSLERLGGPCHINACALGETMLSKDIVELVRELLEEGHYVSVVTNGTISGKIEQILLFPGSLLDRMFFKLSFHYAELQRTKLLGRFWENVEKIKDSPCSYSIEITPSDSLVGDIEDIRKHFADRADGAMPHITFTRDGSKKGLDLLSGLPLEEYRDTWKVFQSDLFDMKCGLYKRKICENCYAGNWSYRINTVNGNLQSCYGQELSGTIFDREQEMLPVMTVGPECRMDYCFNSHAFLAWGDVPQIQCPAYLSVRNRAGCGFGQWIKKPYAAAMNQKLYDNNFEYLGKWDDYEKLMKPDREPAFILFNSPDYTNLGDHAIAAAERALFKRIFPETEFLEVSCGQYIRENLLLRKAVKPEDILIISGGGYLGTLWLWLEDLTKNIIHTYKENKIVIFPQTMYFEESSLGSSEKQSLSEVCGRHKDLTIMLRDRMSYCMAESMFPANVKKMWMPDIALSLQYESACERRGAMVCFRDDRESIGADINGIEKKLQEYGLETRRISTVSNENVYLNNREKHVENMLKTISSARVVVTDRLHAMIFCAITDTPCVAFDNVSGKVSQTYEILKGNGRTILCNGPGQLDGCLQDVLGAENMQPGIPLSVERRFAELEKYLKENCFLQGTQERLRRARKEAEP